MLFNHRTFAQSMEKMTGNPFKLLWFQCAAKFGHKLNMEATLLTQKIFLSIGFYPNILK
jgi:hypothetical protein